VHGSSSAIAMPTLKRLSNAKQKSNGALAHFPLDEN
jgi:hypothetical protein